MNLRSLPIAGAAAVFVTGLWLAACAAAQTEDLFTADRSVEEMAGKQVVFETTHGSFIVEVLPEKAPNHAAFFLLQAEEGNYDGTAFHRVIARGIVQGGDPLSRDPEATEAYGTGGCCGSPASRTTNATSGAPSPRSRSPAARTAPAPSSSSW